MYVKFEEQTHYYSHINHTQVIGDNDFVLLLILFKKYIDVEIFKFEA